ncbi:MAG: hypothetical protein ACOX1S_03945 [Anaerostipes sp.]|jgi:chromosome segregation ATPase
MDIKELQRNVETLRQGIEKGGARIAQLTQERRHCVGEKDKLETSGRELAQQARVEENPNRRVALSNEVNTYASRIVVLNTRIGELSMQIEKLIQDMKGFVGTCNQYQEEVNRNLQVLDQSINTFSQIMEKKYGRNERVQILQSMRSLVIENRDVGATCDNVKKYIESITVTHNNE